MKTFAMCLSLAALLVGCASETQQTAEPKLASATTNGPQWPVYGPGADRFIGVDLGPDGFQECQRISPKFPFDSALTYAQDRAQITALALCLNSPTMRDRTVLLVGHADQSGSDPHNDKLGMKRAAAIRQFLIDEGIAPSRISATTAGETGALGGTGEYADGYDRRVDVVVRGGAHAP